MRGCLISMSNPSEVSDKPWFTDVYCFVEVHLQACMPYHAIKGHPWPSNILKFRDLQGQLRTSKSYLAWCQQRPWNPPVFWFASSISSCYVQQVQSTARLLRQELRLLQGPSGRPGSRAVETDRKSRFFGDVVQWLWCTLHDIFLF